MRLDVLHVTRSQVAMLNHRNLGDHNYHNQMDRQKGLSHTKLCSWLIGHGAREAKEWSRQEDSVTMVE